MKIKTDFVTNSSSTGFIVSIPKDFVTDIKKIIEHFEYYNHEIDMYEDTLTSESRILSEFNTCLDLLKDGDNLWYYGDEGTDWRIYNAMTEICDENGFLMAVMDISSEGNNIIKGIKEEDVNKWFMNTQLHKLKIEVDDEQNKNCKLVTNQTM